MRSPVITPSAEPFLFPGSRIGCLLIHGFTGTPKEMRWLGEYLAEKGYTVLGIRLPGHATEPTDMVRTRWWDWMASVEDGIQLLQGSCEQIILIGLSMGGALALTAATNYSINGVVAMSTPFDLNAGWKKHFLRQLSIFTPAVPKSHTENHYKNTKKEQVSYPFYPTRSLAELADLLKEMRTCLPKIKIPVLLLQGRLDTTSPPNNIELIFNLIGTQDKKIEWLENSGHILPRDNDRFKVYESINQFINRLKSNNK